MPIKRDSQHRGHPPLTSICGRVTADAWDRARALRKYRCRAARLWLRRDPASVAFFSVCEKAHSRLSQAALKMPVPHGSVFFADQGWGAGREPTPLPGSTCPAPGRHISSVNTPGKRDLGKSRTLSSVHAYGSESTGDSASGRNSHARQVYQGAAGCDAAGLWPMTIVRLADRFQQDFRRRPSAKSFGDGGLTSFVICVAAAVTASRYPEQAAVSDAPNDGRGPQRTVGAMLRR